MWWGAHPRPGTVVAAARRVNQCRRACRRRYRCGAIGFPSGLPAASAHWRKHAPVMLLADSFSGESGFGLRRSQKFSMKASRSRRCQACEGFALFIRNDVRHFLVEPGPVGSFNSCRRAFWTYTFFIRTLPLQRSILVWFEAAVPGLRRRRCASWDLRSAAGSKPDAPMRTKRKPRTLNVIALNALQSLILRVPKGLAILLTQ